MSIKNNLKIMDDNRNNIILGLFSKDPDCNTFNKYADKALSLISIESIVSITNVSRAKLDSDGGVSDFVYTILGSEKHSDEFINLCFLGGSPVSAFNMVIDSISRKNYYFKDRDLDTIIPETLRSSLSKLARSFSSDPRLINKTVEPRVACFVFDMLIDEGCSVSDILMDMSVREIIASKKSLARNGISILNGIDEITSLYGLSGINKDLKREHLEGIFELISKSKGRIKAQKEIDDSQFGPSDISFLNPSEFSAITKGNAREFISMAMDSKEDIYENIVRMIINSCRESGELGLIDGIDKAHTKKLIKKGVITMDDLNYMPIALNENKKAKIGYDFGV